LLCLLIIQVVGKFSAVSVPVRNGKRGIGKALVRAAEQKVQSIAQQRLALLEGWKGSALLQMGVINLRRDLFPWYEGQGFVIKGEIRPSDPEVELITLDDMKSEVCCVLMEKALVLKPSG
jgi:hypothetical protein